MQGLRFNKSSIKQNKTNPSLKESQTQNPWGWEGEEKPPPKKTLKKTSLPISFYSLLLLSFLCVFLLSV